MAEIDLEAIEALATAATPGPWTLDDTNYDDLQRPTRFAGPVVIYADSDCDIHPVADCSCNHTCREEEAQRSNATFIAAARTDIPALLTALRERDAEIARLREVNEKLVADIERGISADFSCERCGAPMFSDEDFVSDPDCVRGCWASMTDRPSKNPRPCWAYRVGKPSAPGSAS